MKKSILAVIILMFLTSFANDTTPRKGKGFMRVLWERFFQVKKVNEKIEADSKVSIALVELLLDSNQTSLIKIKDSINKK